MISDGFPVDAVMFGSEVEAHRLVINAAYMMPFLQTEIGSAHVDCPLY